MSSKSIVVAREAVPMIPTTSLFMIADRVRDRLDDMVFELRAKHTFTDSNPTKINPAPYICAIRPNARTDIKVNYSVRKHASEPFSIPSVVTEVSKLGAVDMYVSHLVLRYQVRNGVQVDERRIFFENIPPHPDSEITEFADRMRLNWLHSQGISTFPPGERRRILLYRETRSRDNHLMDPHHSGTLELIRRINSRVPDFVMTADENQVNNVQFEVCGYRMRANSVWAPLLR